MENLPHVTLTTKCAAWEVPLLASYTDSVTQNLHPKPSPKTFTLFLTDLRCLLVRHIASSTAYAALVPFSLQLFLLLLLALLTK